MSTARFRSGSCVTRCLLWSRSRAPLLQVSLEVARADSNRTAYPDVRQGAAVTQTIDRCGAYTEPRCDFSDSEEQVCGTYVTGHHEACFVDQLDGRGRREQLMRVLHAERQF
jgi:hypothetical protein